MRKDEKRRKPQKTRTGALFCPASFPASVAPKSGVDGTNCARKDKRLEPFDLLRRKSSLVHVREEEEEEESAGKKETKKIATLGR